ncbi:MAG: lysylphosphatidylglycerol synthase domain-containing protein [Oscillatoria sp. PMC 1076.18]|nr:lysylphosphatidylglycerol synthase domain-containing protein [Oscillatoria sp. PMC 1076.18]
MQFDPKKIKFLMQQIISRLKPYLRWLILGITLFFLIQALKSHWQEVVAIRLDDYGWIYLILALIVTLAAHIWCGWVWFSILKEFKQTVTSQWAIIVFLKTNIAKYLPGNIWHFSGRILAATAANIPFSVATVSVIIEPLLMAAAALLIALLTVNSENWLLQLTSLVVIFAIIHPRVLNPLIKKVSKSKLKKTATIIQKKDVFQIDNYPVRPLIGELIFVLLRSIGFLLTVVALTTINPSKIILLLSAFSLAWLLGLVVPGAPGGMGVFEATALALLREDFSTGTILGAVALYRLISILAEASGAGLAWLAERYFYK